MRAVRTGTLASLGALLAACSSAPRHGAEHARTPPPPPANVADAVPRAEPRSSHGNPPFYDVNGRRYQVLASADNYVERGVASWYGPDFQGHNTSSGERYDMYAMTAAHKTLPIPCYARITNLSNGRSVIVRINDRGPFVGNRIVDLSYSAATRLDIVRNGTAFVELRTVGPGTSIEPATAPILTASVPVAAPAPAAALGALPPVTNPVPAPVEEAAAEPMQPPTPAPAAPPAVPPSDATTATVALYIQVGAFADENNAQHLIAKLQGAGIAQVFSVPSTDSGRTLRRVRIGPISTVEEYDRLAAQLSALGYPDARLAND